MNRKDFLKTSALGLGGITLLSSFGNLNLDSEKFPVNELLGKKRPALFGNNFNLRKDAADSFDAMRKAAKKAGFNIYSVSSYRSYSHQNRIWERKYKLYRSKGFTNSKTISKIIEYSTIPGTSRHHWGTDLDMIDVTKPAPTDPLSAKHFRKGGQYYEFKLWLNQHAESFGFYEVYTNTKGRKGFKYEPWHFSYKPLAIEILKEYQSLNIKEILQENKLMGSTYFTSDFINKYNQENILDINPVLLP